jgi:hypothetical protein
MLPGETWKFDFNVTWFGYDPCFSHMPGNEGGAEEFCTTLALHSPWPIIRRFPSPWCQAAVSTPPGIFQERRSVL